MHHFFPQPINSPSATSLPTKSRIITYSPFFSLHSSFLVFLNVFFFLVLLFLSSKISTKPQVRNGGAQPLQSHAAAWVEVRLEESWIQRSLAMGKTWVRGPGGGGWGRRPRRWAGSRWLLLASKIHIFERRYQKQEEWEKLHAAFVRILAHQQ